MECELVKINSIKDEALTKAAEFIKNGGLVAFPTETVYGLGGDGLNSEAASKIYKAKGRPSDNPLILHINDQKMLHKIVNDVNSMAKKIMTAFCPGPITLILPKSDIVPSSVTGGLNTVAVRMPDNDIARELIRLSNTPIAAPSANISGRPSPTTAQAVYNDLHDRIDMILDGGACHFGVESTIVDCTEDVPIILRPGAITKEMLEELFPVVKIDRAIVGENVVPKAPGMKYKHYAPKANMILFEGSSAKMADAIANKIADYEREGKKVGLVVSSEVAEKLQHENTAIYGNQEDLLTIASEIYECLRFFDDKDVDIILAEGTTDKGIGLAIMNRLHKASGFNSIFID
ncbi:t(6)A37 threonylcarbamoyladenosine biosynthesis protein RimN [Megamonas hypermegale]|uniref:Threonylcarbamoyl-AMP synthase n=1 Tax=Megamonas hypermegale TaxID=158847 RepID=A0A239TQF6_9FIRM|nr:L-threonylcarbamoyladenylate synthase [Megamonas hypermegale]SNV00010.1 t(6)A37 threonylcarbamoyladenosine biosynthesis protein RimN [Megamonas hypermegale]